MRIGADPNAENSVGQSPLHLATAMKLQGKVPPSFLDALDIDEYVERRDNGQIARRREALEREQALALQQQLRERYRGTAAANTVFCGPKKR